MSFSAFGPLLRRFGQALDRVGAGLQASHAYTEKLVVSTRVVPFKGKELAHGLQAFVASSATVVGDVSLGEQSSVWYSAQIRADHAAVKIGKKTNVQDGAQLVAAKGAGEVVIGDNVTISAGAFVSSSVVEDGATVGMGACVLPGCVIGKNAFVDSGAVVPAGTTIPPGELWSGSPATKLRPLVPDEVSYLSGSNKTYVQLAESHLEQALKTPSEVGEQLALRDFRIEQLMEPDEPMPQTPPDVEQYYRLSAAPEDQGLFRTQNLNDEEVLAQMVKEQEEADLEEEAYLNQLASNDRLWVSLKQLADVRPDRASQREALVAQLEKIDPQAADTLRGLIQKAADAAAAGELSAFVDSLPPKAEKAVVPDVLAALSQHGAAAKPLSA